MEVSTTLVRTKRDGSSSTGSGGHNRQRQGNHVKDGRHGRSGAPCARIPRIAADLLLFGGSLTSDATSRSLLEAVESVAGGCGELSPWCKMSLMIGVSFNAHNDDQGSAQKDTAEDPLPPRK